MGVKYYPKINSLYKRDERGKFIPHDYACEEFLQLADVDWEWTYKWNGTCAGVWFRPDRVNEAFGKSARSELNGEMMQALFTWGIDFPQFKGTGLTVYGELVGPKIQSNLHGLETVEFKPFDVRDAEGRWWPKHRVQEHAGGGSVLVASLDLVETELRDPTETDSGAIAGFFEGQYGTYEEGVVGTPNLCNLAGERIITKFSWDDYRPS